MYTYTIAGKNMESLGRYASLSKTIMSTIAMPRSNTTPMKIAIKLASGLGDGRRDDTGNSGVTTLVPSSICLVLSPTAASQANENGA